MVTFLSGGTGTPKLLAGLGETPPAETRDGGDPAGAGGAAFDPGATTVIANTGDDVELGGLFVCPDLDTVLYLLGNVLDRETWWGIAEDSARTHEYVRELAAAAGRSSDPQYLPADRQTAGRALANWRRFSAVGEFMHIGDRDRAVHITRTSLIDEGRSLTEATETLADAFDLQVEPLPMSDDPVATIVETTDGEMHFQEFWVAHDGEPTVQDVGFRGGAAAAPTPAVRAALADPVVIGPSNPVTSVGPMLALDGFEAALAETTVVAVSPFVEDRVFSGPADELMAAVGYEPSTAGVATAYPFADAFVLDEADGTELNRPVVRTDTAIADDRDAARVRGAVRTALEVAG